MINFIQILKFLLINICGFFITPLINTLAIKANAFPEVPGKENIDTFTYLLAGGMWFWIFGALFSIGYFFVERKKLRIALFLMPVIAPALYSTIILIWLNTKPLG